MLGKLRRMQYYIVKYNLFVSQITSVQKQMIIIIVLLLHPFFKKIKRNLS